MTQLDIAPILTKMTEETNALLSNRQYSHPLMVGIHTGGIHIAKILHTMLNLSTPLAEISATFYRDDFSRIGMHPEIKTSKMPCDVENRHLLLVDDVLYTGRTVRAAMNEIFDYGRPTSINLLVLIDRNERELPIQADIIGQTLQLKKGEQIKLSHSPNLVLEIIKP